MRRHRLGNEIRSVICAGGIAACSAFTAGQQISVTYDTPDRDRWMYPFNATPGLRNEAPVFSAAEIPGFDDRDAQFIVGWNTNEGDATIPAGEGVERYRILSLTVTAAISQTQWSYDDTYDSFRSRLMPTDKDFVEDEDPSAPAELHVCGYRGPFSAANWTEDAGFGGPPVVPPAEGARFIFSGVFDDNGDLIDASNSIRERFEAEPIAVGKAEGFEPGDLIPVDTVLTFEADLSDPNVRTYLAESLDLGKINLSISSYLFGSQDPREYPAFWTKDDGFGETATLTVEVCVGARADWDCSGVINAADVGAFLSDYFVDLNEQSGVADFDGNGVTNAADVGDFLSTYFMSL